MKARYNFDKVPRMASGIGVHATSIASAWSKAYALAKKAGYTGKLVFRDNMKCPGRNDNDQCCQCDVCN